MTEVRKIQCPSCGSNSTYKLFDGSYKCNYCQGSFMVNEQQQQRPAPLNRPQGNVAGTKPKMIIGLVLGIFVVMATAATVFYITAGTSIGSPESSISVSHQPPAVKMTKAFAGSAGSVIWIISEKPCSADNHCYELLVVDPGTNTLKGKQEIGVPFRPNTGVNLNQVFGSNFLKYGDLAYSIRNDTGLIAYNIYTGKAELTTALLSGKIPGPAAGILKVEHYSADRVFKIITTAGDVLNLDPYSGEFVPEEKPKNRKEEAVTKDLYLSDGLKHNLYAFTKRGNGFPIVFGNLVQESRLPGPDASKTNNVKDIFGNIHIEKVSDKNYFRAQPLLRDEQGNLVLLYRTDLTETSPVILESINTEGKTNWSLQDTLFLSIGKAFASQDLGCEYTYSNTNIIIGLYTEEKEYVGVDVKTGKVLWRFNPQAYLTAHASS